MRVYIDIACPVPIHCFIILSMSENITGTTRLEFPFDLTTI